MDVIVVVCNAVFEVLDIFGESVDFNSECFEGNQDVCCLVNIILVVRLYDDIVAEVKIIDSLIVVRGVVFDCNFGSTSNCSKSCERTRERPAGIAE
jgi:hypothetical protein